MQTDKLPPAIFLMGPTASGKTDLAIALREHLPVDIISVDSALIYRDMNIGTAKPDAETLAQSPHRLVDIIDPNESYSVARFREDALREMQAIQAAGRIPLLVGGTMLYFRALEYGLSVLPEADAEIRQTLENRLQTEGLSVLHDELAALDAQAAARIHPNDPQRILRALEVCLASGVSMSSLHAQGRGDTLPYQVVKLVLCPEDRSVLHQRIETRFNLMLDQGLVDEVQMLQEKYCLHGDMPSMRAVGYRQVCEYLNKQLHYKEMVERGIIATRQLAKRQITWLRKYEDAHWFQGERVSVDKVIGCVTDADNLGNFLK